MGHRIIAQVDVETAGDSVDSLGEGVHWDAERDELLRVDLYEGRVHRLSVDTWRQQTLDFDGPVGFAIPRSSGGIVIGVGHEVVVVDEGGTRRRLAHLEGELATSRVNDGKCDSMGRLWARTLSRIRQRGAASLYRIDPDGEVNRVLGGVTMGNGLGWSLGADLMYYVDSTTRQVDVFDFDASAGTIANRRTLVTIDARLGMPDGMTVDSEGGVWVALFRGGAVHRYSPDGQLDVVVDLPVATPTTVAFGGSDLGDLYVTSANHRLGPSESARDPLAGRLFRLRPGYRGIAPSAFSG